MKVSIFHVFFGTLPNWFPYFIESCRYNTNIHFIIVTDNQGYFDEYDNIFVLRMKVSDFEHLIKIKTGINAKLTNPYKICDLRPTFGQVFNDYLSNSHYWGYCDNDLIFGNLKKFIPDELICDNDIISVYDKFLSGPFCLYKNAETICSLYRLGYNYLSILSDEKQFAYDENIIRKQYKGLNLKKTVVIGRYILSNLKLLLRQTSFKQLRYDFQWYYKKKMLSADVPVDMTEIVWSQIGRITPYFDQLMFSDAQFFREKNFNWILKWEKGILLDMVSGKEIMAFHFMESKKRDFHVKSFPDRNKLFHITPQGIF